MFRRLSFLLLIPAVLAALLAAPSTAHAAKKVTCASIDDFKISQTMLWNGGHYQLDADRDGIACESYITKTKAPGEPSSKQGKALYRWTYWMTHSFPATQVTRWNNLLNTYYDVYSAPVSKYGLKSNMYAAHDAIYTASRTGSNTKFACLRGEVLKYVKASAKDKDIHKDMQKLFGNAEKAAKGAPGSAQIVKNYMKLGGKLATSAAGVMGKAKASKYLAATPRLCALK